MTDIFDLDPVDDNNQQNWPENTMEINQLNNAGRADEGLLARWYSDASTGLLTAGTDPAFTVTTDRTTTAYFQGLDLRLQFHAAAADAITLNVNGLGAVPVRYSDGSELGGAPVGTFLDIVYSGTGFTITGIAGVDISIADNAVAKGTGTGIEASGVSIDDDNNMSGQGVEISAEAASRTITLSDNGKVLDVDTSAAGVTLTLPENATETLPEGFQCVVIQDGANAVTIATEGSDTIRSFDGLTGTAGDQAAISIIKTKSGVPNEYWLGGNLG